MLSPQEQDIVARTLLGEAEAWDVEDAEAIANVIMTRMRHRLWPDTASGVCLQPRQFSCWNSDKNGRARIMAATLRDEWFKVCFRIAGDALAGRLADKTSGATHYYATYIKAPKWSRGKVPVYRTPKGKYEHLFFNDIDTPPPATAAAALAQERPLATSRTVIGAGVAAAGSLAQPITDQVKEWMPAISLAQEVGRYAPWAMTALILGGVAWIIYARWDDRRKGLR